MQTFVPYPDFETSMRVLDLKRLGKQRVEVIQIVRALTVPGYAWASHPAVLMWKGYEEALGRYGLTACAVWTERGFGDTCAETIVADLLTAGVVSIREYAELAEAGELPPWLFDEDLQISHRSSLLRKDPEHYGPLFPPGTPTDVDYVWPVRSPAVIEREQRQAQAAQRRAERAAEKLARERERARKKRSAAAKRGWQARTAERDDELTPESIFQDFPEGLVLYCAVADAVAAIGEAAVRVTKSQIAFRRRKGFAYVWRPGQYLKSDVPAVLSIALPREVASDRFKEVAHPSAKVWMHHLELTNTAQIDDEVRDWLTEAYQSAG